ncbi:O-methyltransferase [Salinibacterium hongtaonis]|uniref:Methyltransferase domain-containing protein n=1 Tax=Homoserinimonas hongtaonis TaxID=2079791 RepID=A0A2U1SZZ2_9MICO|nr:class I SAM-dependent methyltransferase [Salinibacterium hongtaonis]AWB89723.1 methyltransferase [Salinibacterium hongtaonis]PWB97176.1 methyltransferase domain-containing protein [Salinibacterium hongtaonis]
MSEKDSNWRFVDEVVVESPVIQQARQHSLELGIEPIAPSIGAQIALIAAATSATTMIEIGTGAGVSGLWLMQGAPDAILTSIDIEPDHQQVARKHFADADIPANRTRLITGRSRDVLPRMNEQSYDIVLIDGDPKAVIENVEHGLRLVRPGGTVLVPHALWHDRVADPTKRDDTTANFRAILKETSESAAVLSALSPAGDGLLQLTPVRSS